MDDELGTERRRIGIAFLTIALLAPVLVAVPSLPRGSAGEVVGYLVLTLVAGLATVLRWDDAARSAGLVAVTYTIAVVLLRDAGGAATSGLAPLLLLPLFWCSLIGTRRSVALAVVASALALALPIVVVGADRYPPTEWRRTAIWLTVAPIVGLATLRLRQRAERAQASAVTEARTDPLTGVLNRRGLEEVAAREVARAQRSATPLVVALLDLDHFKRFNDTQGHDAGDDLLRDAAGAWGATLRTTDVLARWGGEEFVVLLPDTTRHQAVDVVERLRAATPRGQTCSVGVASVGRSKGGDDLAAAIKRADTALYAAKEQGRDRVVLA